MPDARYAVETSNLTKIYQVGDSQVVALNRVNLQIEPGTFVAVVGTSGSGKSTLLNMLAGLESPTFGEVWVAGQALHKMNENQLVTFRREKVGFIFQSFNLIQSMTALENVAWPLAFRGVDKQLRTALATRVLTQLGLATHMNHRPNQLSGGQQQRVGIARALVVNPKIVFADEPTGNLDSRTTAATLRLFRTVSQKYKQTWVMVTHDPNIAAFADITVSIFDGRIVNIHDNRQQLAMKGLS